MNNPEIVIKDCEAKDIREMAKTMHAKSMETAFRLGISPNKALWKSWKQSIYCKSVFLNGKIAAIFGLCGCMFGEKGLPWLIMTPEVEEYPMRVAFIYKKELQKMAKMHPLLEDYVEATHDKAIRMLSLMGFKIGTEIMPIGEGKFLRAERAS